MLVVRSIVWELQSFVRVCRLLPDGGSNAVSDTDVTMVLVFLLCKEVGPENILAS